MRDIVFEEVYRKRVESMMDNAYAQGIQYGQAHAAHLTIEVINEMHNAKAEITPDSFAKAFMDKQMELHKKMQGDVSSESESRVNDSSVKDAVEEEKTKNKKPTFTIVK